MEIIFTSLSTSKTAKFTNVKPSGFMFEEEIGTMKVISSPTTNSYSGNGTVEDAVGTIAGAINEAPTTERRRLLLELEIINDYFKHNKEISDFIDKILIKIGYLKNNKEIYDFIDKILIKIGDRDDWN